MDVDKLVPEAICIDCVKDLLNQSMRILFCDGALFQAHEKYKKEVLLRHRIWLNAHVSPLKGDFQKIALEGVLVSQMSFRVQHK